MRKAAIFIALTLMAAPLHAETAPPRDLDPGALRVQVTGDLESVGIYRQGLASVLDFVRANPEVFAPPKPGSERKPPTRASKETMWETWKTFLDYTLALESLRQYYADFPRVRDASARADAFLACQAAFLAQYRFALELIQALDGHPLADAIFDDPVPEIGLPARTWADFRFRFLNVARAAEFAAMTVAAGGLENDRFPATRAVVAEDAAAIWRAGKGTGEALTLKNALKVIGDTGFRAWFPVQAGVAQWMGDVKLRRPGQTLIQPRQIELLAPVLEPGDILLERREWFLSNAGLPGFWTHAALYVGTPDERRRFFDSAEVRDWVRNLGTASGEIEDLLRDAHPEAYRRSLLTAEDGNVPRVIEAIAAGVSFTTLEHSAAADSLAVLRPRLCPTAKARAVLRAFRYSGRPYDYNFDFLTDSALVCSELVCKAYEAAPDAPGLAVPVETVMGRMVVPPNRMARLFDAEHGSPERQLDLVVFLDGNERGQVAAEGSEEEFRKSWTRPKWHVLVQGEGG